jgi:myo-inositol-1(or 4)-monophosphatase
MGDPNFSKDTLFAMELALMAGDILKKGFDLPFKKHNKEGVHNLVTEFDLKSESAIISTIKKKYPKASILSEEAGNDSIESQMRWIIDPLDGTVNFAHHIPFFSVNIAIQMDLETITAVTFSPMTEELFVAEKGKGSFLNGQKIGISETKDINKAILATGFPYNLTNNPEKCIDRFLDIIKTGIPIRRLGSAALDLAYLAAGRFDGYWETNLGPWDCAPGVLLIEEAKGKVTDWKGSPFKLSSYNTLVGSNNKIHETLIDILKKS